ncbi:uncharacterized protein LOC142639445 [Castanea sativa]|uniref:uncharacterized protein LOC142639445 n=1 Tax=Castanea sativa TaxID=21020 RepID=UPI003F650B0E
MRVSDLIDPTTHKWNRNLLQGLFIPHEAKLIASIPICMNKVEDEVIWPFTPSGCYTVKSGSKFLATKQCRSQHISHTPNNNGLWKMIWGLSILSKAPSKPGPYLIQRVPIVASIPCRFRGSSHIPPSYLGRPKQIHHNRPASVKWSPPPLGRVKVNFGGALFKDIGKAGLGVIIRDCNGQAIASLSEQASMPFSPDIAEAMVAARALSFAQDLGYTSFILEGDSANIITAQSSNETSLSTYGHILSSAKATLGADSCVSFSHVRRSGNSIAHNLAKHARYVRGLLVWTEDVPPHLISVILTNHG